MAKPPVVKFKMSCTEVSSPRGGAVRATFQTLGTPGGATMQLHAPNLPEAKDLDPETDYEVTFTPIAK